MARYPRQEKESHPRIMAHGLLYSKPLPIWELTSKQLRNWQIVLAKKPYERNLHETILMDSTFSVKKIMEIFNCDAQDVRIAIDECVEMYGCL